jgi:hypothetical protein
MQPVLLPLEQQHQQQPIIYSVFLPPGAGPSQGAAGFLVPNGRDSCFPLEAGVASGLHALSPHAGHSPLLLDGPTGGSASGFIPPAAMPAQIFALQQPGSIGGLGEPSGWYVSSPLLN